jgi:hypothetical protein
MDKKILIILLYGALPEKAIVVDESKATEEALALLSTDMKEYVNISNEQVEALNRRESMKNGDYEIFFMDVEIK